MPGKTAAKDAGLRAVFRELERRANEGLDPWTKTGLAKSINVHKQAINSWVKVPGKHVPAVSKVLGIKKSLLRPDLYDASDDGHGAHAGIERGMRGR